MLTIDQYFSSIFLRISRAHVNVQMIFFKHTRTLSFFLRSVNFLHLCTFNSEPSILLSNKTSHKVSMNSLLSVFFNEEAAPITEIIKQPKSKQNYM